MTAHDYLASLLAGHTLRNDELAPLQQARDGIERWLRSDIGSAPRIYYGGSYAKHTMLRLKYDLDIIVYFPSTQDSTLQQLFNRVHQRLLVGKYIVEPRTVALRLPYETGFHIDIVPGKAQDGTFRYATLFKNTQPPSTLQTSLKVHIESVNNADLSDIVRLAKLWRLRHNLELASFPLEIAVQRAMFNVRRDNLETAMLAVLRYFISDFQGARFVDPANTNNVIEVAPRVRSAVTSQAQRSLAQPNWGQLVW